MGFLIFLLITCAAVPAGAQFLRLARLCPREVPERLLMSAAVGYVLLGYGTLLLGLTHHLTSWSCAVMLALFAVAGLGNWDLLWEWVIRGLSEAAKGFLTRTHAVRALLLILLGAATYITAVEPPGGRDFDGLAEHLAQAAYYARHEVVQPLLHDHHSQFPSNMQMLYTLGLTFQSVTAAKLFHWFYGLLAVAAVFLIARRFLDRRAGTTTLLILATCPMVIWLAGVAYVDLGVMVYGLLAVLAFLRWQRDGKPPDLILAALLAGCGMTVKMQGIPLFGVLMLAALIVRPRVDGAASSAVGGAFSPDQATPPTPAVPRASAGFTWRLKWTLLATVVGLLIACPWYIRSYVNTGNPVYPFAYSIFGGKHWSADRAAAYQVQQLNFGLGDIPSPEQLAALPAWRRPFTGPREPWKWLIAPLGLTYLPSEYEVNLGQLANLLMTSVGPLWLALLPLLLFMRARPPALRLTLWLFLPLWVWWFMSMQLGRYLMPSLALVAPAAGYALARMLRGGQVSALLAGAAAGLWSITALGIALLLAFPAVPVVFGLQSREAYLQRNLDVYEPSAYIASHLPAEAVVATYGEVRTFYFDRDAFWAEAGHSDLIAYDQMKGPADLVRRFRELGITHVLLNQTYLPNLWSSQDQTIRLLREGIEQGQLDFMIQFPVHRQYILLAVPGVRGSP